MSLLWTAVYFPQPPNDVHVLEWCNRLSSVKTQTHHSQILSQSNRFHLGEHKIRFPFIVCYYYCFHRGQKMHPWVSVHLCVCPHLICYSAAANWYHFRCSVIAACSRSSCGFGVPHFVRFSSSIHCLLTLSLQLRASAKSLWAHGSDLVTFYIGILVQSNLHQPTRK